jgi:hypothetical protein
MSHLKFVALVGLLALFVSSGCRKKSGTTPDGALDGVWTGAIVDSVLGTGDLELDMSQTYDTLNGIWSATFSGGAPPRSGTVGGVVASSNVTLFLSPATSISCASRGTLSGTLTVTATVAANRLAGSYVILTCSGATTGTIDVAR